MGANECFILVAGRYEGIDERLLELEIDEEWSVGDFVLSGGELAAMTIIDVATRLIPGALGSENSATEDSLSGGLLKYSQYTRPESIGGLNVPSVLMSGDHKAIHRWRLKQSLGKTWLKRPDLLEKVDLDTFQLELLMEFIRDQK
jgi:tRNA (guanine37-N1)-methyltransferase